MSEMNVQNNGSEENEVIFNDVLSDSVDNINDSDKLGENVPELKEQVTANSLSAHDKKRSSQGDIDYAAYGVDVTKKKKKVKERPSLTKLLNPKNLQTEVNRYGYNFSIKKFYLSIFVAMAVAIGVGILFKLAIPYILFVFLICMLCLPSLLLTSYKNMYESKRFHDISNYMEQLLYSFRRKKKILTSLEDVLVAFDSDNGTMSKLIKEAINYIKTSDSDGDIYREALDIIENEYSNSRLRNLHNFLIAVERNGGDVENPVDLLLNERSMWDERVHGFQKERNAVKRNIILSICCSLLLCFFILYILSMNRLEPLKMPQNIVVQISSTFVIVASVLLYTKVVNKLSQSWLKRENKSSDYQILKDYFYVVNYNKAKEWKSAILWTAITSPIWIFGLIFSKALLTILGAAISLFCLFSPVITFNLSKKSTVKEIEKAFPQWLMELALILQDNNVQVGISKTVGTAPIVLRPELEKMVKAFETDTNSILPYTQFLKDFDLPEIKSATRMLYSITTTGTGNIDEQITGLIRRQNVLIDKAEKINNEESLAGFSIWTMLPMLFCIVKSMMDMTVLVFSLFGMISI